MPIRREYDGTCITRVAAAGGFMISAAGNRDKVPGTGLCPGVRGWGEGAQWVSWGLGGPVARMLGPRSQVRKSS